MIIKNNKYRINEITENINSINENEFLSLGSIQTVDSVNNKQWSTHLMLDNLLIDFQIDTGLMAIFLPIGIFNKFDSGQN